ncbi:uncharacterized protein LOC110237295 [Exaiptasia diaphana]|uniref:MULE transposase domain-containing protein n=1 Tax=Exaiptasia diaphana TaxID=2652724 RepID=A0A913X411_EXADI|nr:uncharacterized protein LOC110237295 [Exaiptasia diaphana]
MLPTVPRVKRIVLDFEKSAWKALSRVLPTVKLSGCSFHWSKAVWRKIQYLGLQAAYHEDRAAQTFLRNVMALPYIPADDIEEMFNRLHEQANQNDSLLNLLQYVRKTWIYANRWDPTTWSAYRRNIRTNNDIEGWHNRINQTSLKQTSAPILRSRKTTTQGSQDRRSSSRTC